MTSLKKMSLEVIKSLPESRVFGTPPPLIPQKKIVVKGGYQIQVRNFEFFLENSLFFNFGLRTPEKKRKNCF